MATTQLKFVCVFGDKEERTVTISNVNTATLPANIGTLVKNFNDATQRATNFPGFDTAFISPKSGAQFSRIRRAQVITTERTYLT